MKTNIFKLKSFWLSMAVCFIPVIVGLILYNKLPDMVATHFGADFTPDSYSPKWMTVFGIPGILAVINLFLWFMLEADPKGKSINKNMKAVSRWIVPILSVFVNCAIIVYSLNNGINMMKFIPLLVGIILILTGNYMPKCRQNYTAGIKLPWTLASEENWNRTHRFGGKLMVICGFVIIPYTFFEINIAVFFISIMIAAIAPAVYSYVLYKKGI